MKEKKHVWILSEESNVKRCGNGEKRIKAHYLEASSLSFYPNYMKMFEDESNGSNYYVYEDFETAKEKMKSIIQDYATTDNGMFDGQGHIVELCKYANSNAEVGENQDTNKMFSELGDKLAHFLTGEKTYEESNFQHFEWLDWLAGCQFLQDEYPYLAIMGVDDGPCNGINPYIYMNIFEMDNPDETYLFHIKDMFNEWETERLNYIELKLVKVEI